MNARCPSYLAAPRYSVRMGIQREFATASACGRQPKLGIQVSSFEAVCRMIEAGVGIGIIPESAARRHSRTMRLAVVKLDELWAVRERSILVRELEALPGSIRALIATLRQEPDPAR